MAAHLAAHLHDWVNSLELKSPNCNSDHRCSAVFSASRLLIKLCRLMWPVTRRLMIAGMNARPVLVEQVERQLGAELDWFDRRLDGRRHLVGDRLGRADITAASLLGPL